MDCTPHSQPDAENDAVDAALFEGHVDAIEAGRIYGWALDPVDPARRLCVTIFHGDEALATVLADRYREDLRDYGDGTGRHAFVFTLPKPLWDAEPAAFHVTHAGSSVPLVRPDRDARRVFRGSDGASGGALGGEPGAGDGGLGGGPDWLAPVAARLGHLETALVSTARAAALTQINLRQLDRPDRDDRLSSLEQSQLRIDQALKAQAVALSELQAGLDAARGGGRLHLMLTLALLIAVVAMAALAFQRGLLP